MQIRTIATSVAAGAIGMLFLDVRSSSAQTIYGVPGSPAATTTIKGDQLPAPVEKFEGKIERNAAQSKPYWPARIVPPKGAPNVLLIMTDDVGYGTASTFGGVIQWPVGMGFEYFYGFMGGDTNQWEERTLPIILQWDENFDVGADTGTPVNDADYEVPFRFTGKLDKLALTIDRPTLSPADEKMLMEAERNNHMSE